MLVLSIPANQTIILKQELMLCENWLCTSCKLLQVISPLPGTCWTGSIFSCEPNNNMKQQQQQQQQELMLCENWCTLLAFFCTAFFVPFFAVFLAF
jgi:hypothetical protein